MKAGLVFVLSLALLLTSCATKSQSAIIVGKEHIPAHVEGTPYEEHETDKEQWIVKIEMENGRQANAPVDVEQWKEFDAGDRVRARYSEGKYTGTIWGMDLQKH